MILSCEADDASVIDGLPDAIVDNDPDWAPPRGLDEDWNGHSLELYRQYFDDNVVVYYDGEVERPLEWPYDFLSDNWGYLLRNYGEYGDGNMLYAIFHSTDSEIYSATRLDEETSNRNIIDVPMIDTAMSSANKDLLVGEMAGLVENSIFGRENSPAEGLWGDNFREILIYDSYRAVDLTEDAERVVSTFSENSSNSPAENTYWFRDWFLPIYTNHNGSVALNNFFRIASENYPQEGGSYASSMNVGEMVHFFSGGTGVDLQPLAEEAFGWTEEFQDELIQARTQFTGLNYPFEPTSELLDFTTDAIITVSKESSDGPDGKEGSLKLIDDDVNSKFLVFDLESDFTLWLQQELPESQVVNRYTLTSGNDSPARDPADWEFQGSDDGDTWVVLDSRVDESFSARNLTREFIIENEEAYKYYRLVITKNGGTELLQISEWRLLNLVMLTSSEPTVSNR